MVPKLTLALTILLLTPGGRLCAGDMVNPHWTGTHCLECHTNESGGALRYPGEVIRLCNRCHDGTSAPADPHPVEVALSGAMRKAPPSSWPLQDGTITCLTCHDALPPMHDDPLAAMLNPSFLRSSSAASQGNFCFTCHDQNEYRKENPHRQLDASGTIMEQACLSCHRSVPKQNPAQDSVTPSLRNEANRLCLGCHGGKDVNHPVQGSHLLEVPDSMPDIQRLKTTEQGVSLPLAGKRITCITCHNPHQRGVLKTSGAASGAGEASFLRLQRGKVLCTHCHQDIRVPDAPGGVPQGNLPGIPKPEVTQQHPPYRDEKCKACHAIDGPASGMDDPPVRCFSAGCHETALLKNAFVHERSVLGSCSFCHSPHSAAYAKLLFTDGNTLCSTCHPLLRGPDGSPLRKSDHARYVSYASDNRLLPPGDECRFCHSPSHSEDLQAVSTAQCGACHISIRHMASANRHEQYAEKECSACHLPHGAPHAYLLKKPPETYQRR